MFGTAGSRSGRKRPTANGGGGGDASNAYANAVAFVINGYANVTNPTFAGPITVGNSTVNTTIDANGYFIGNSTNYFQFFTDFVVSRIVINAPNESSLSLTTTSSNSETYPYIALTTDSSDAYIWVNNGNTTSYGGTKSFNIWGDVGSSLAFFSNGTLDPQLYLATNGSFSIAKDVSIGNSIVNTTIDANNYFNGNATNYAKIYTVSTSAALEILTDEESSIALTATSGNADFYPFITLIANAVQSTIWQQNPNTSSYGGANSLNIWGGDGVPLAFFSNGASTPQLILAANGNLETYNSTNIAGTRVKFSSLGNSGNNYIAFDPFSASIEGFKQGEYGTKLVFENGGFSVIDSGNTLDTLFKYDTAAGLYANRIISGPLAGATYNPLSIISNFFPANVTTAAIDIKTYDAGGSGYQSKIRVFNGNGPILLQENGGNVSIGNSTVNVSINSTSVSIGGVTTTSYADTKAATAYANAVADAATDASTKAATAYSNAIATASSDASTKAATAYTNATAYADTKAATAFSNAISTITAGFANTSTPIFTGPITIGNSTVNAVVNSTSFKVMNSTSNATMSIPTTTQWSGNFFLHANGSWVTPSAGVGLPGGANTQVQYNDNGTTSGATGFTYDNTTNNVTIANTLTIGSSTVNTTSFKAGANVFLDTVKLSIGNTTVNTLANSSQIIIQNAGGFLGINAIALVVGSSVVNGTVIAVGSAGMNTSAVGVGANAFLDTVKLSIGNTTANLLANSILVSLSNSTSTANLTPADLKIGSATVNSTIINIDTGLFTTVNATATVQAGTSMKIGNTTIHTDINSTFGVFKSLDVGNANFTGVLTSYGMLSNSSVLTITANSTLTVTIVANSVTVGSSSINSTALIEGANVFLDTTKLSIGNTTANLLANSILVSLSNSTSIANLTPLALTIGTTTVNSTSIGLGANVLLTTGLLSIGNSTVNAVVNSTSFTLAGVSTSTAFVSSRVALAGLNTAVYSRAYLTEYQKEGLWYRISGTALTDPFQGVCVTSTFDGSFYWKREIRDRVNLRWYAEGDGSTNDQNAVANAFTFCQENLYSLKAPQGVYLIDGIIHAPNAASKQFHIEGDGSLNTIFRKRTTTNTALLQLGSTNASIYMAGLVVRGITLDGLNTTTAHSLLTYDLARSLIVDVKCINANTPGMIYGGISSTFIDCSFDGGNTALKVDSFTSNAGGGIPNNLKFQSSYIVNATKYGLYVDNGNRIEFDNCDIEGNGTTLANTAEGGVYIGPNMGSSIAGSDTLTMGVTLNSCWIEANKGLAQVRSDSGKTIIRGSMFFSQNTNVTYDVMVNGGQYTIDSCDASFNKAVNVQEGANTVAGSVIIASNMLTLNVDLTKTTLIINNSITVGSSVINSTAYAAGANVVLDTVKLSIGNTTANVLANSVLISVANSTGTANLQPTQLVIGSSTVNSTAHIAGANVFLDTTKLSIGNSTVNVSISSALSYFTSNVGVGCTSPTYLLEAYASTANGIKVSITNATAPTSGADQGIKIENRDTTSGALAGILFGSYDSGGTTRHAGAILQGKENSWTGGGGDYPSFLSFYTRVGTGGSDTEKVRIAANGNFGIATTTPPYKLSVYDNLTSIVAGILNTNNSTSAHGLGILGGNNTTGGAQLIQFYRNDGTLVGSVSQSNSTAVAYNTTSDVNLKTDIVPTQRGLDELLNIEVVDFRWKDSPGKEKVQGFIAQQFINTYPEAVSVGQNNSPWSMDYGRPMPLVVKSIQELKELNDRLLLRIEALEKRLQ